MFKWQVFALPYDAVLFADIDYSFARGGAAPWERWIRQIMRQPDYLNTPDTVRRRIERFHHRRVLGIAADEAWSGDGRAAQHTTEEEEGLRFLGRPDSSSPINTGAL